MRVPWTWRAVALLLATAIFMAALSLMPKRAAADEWPVDAMNTAINQTNFIVGEGSGHCSGTLISLKYRLILTNHHCIAEYVSYRTKEVVKNGVVEKQNVETLADVEVFQRAYADYRSVGESRYRAKIVAKWEESDLALLQIYAETIPHSIAAPIFAGDAVLRGETVYVVGNPLMLDTSVTRGIISSTQRTFVVPWADNQEVPFIQVDSGMTGGNSGGALYNTAGELIGVPAAGVNGTPVGLAIPFFRVREFLTNNCYGEVWDATAAPREDCLKQQSETAEGASSDVAPQSYCGEPVYPLACGLPGFGARSVRSWLRSFGE